MIQRLILLIAIVIVIPTVGYGGNWRVHLKVCNQDVACAKEQAKATITLALSFICEKVVSSGELMEMM